MPELAGEESSFVRAIPDSESAKRDMLAMQPRPLAWEYALFAYELRAGVDRYESDWRDYSLSYTPVSSRRLPLSQIPSFVGEQMDRSKAIVHTMTNLIEPTPQLRAFAANGEPGDRALIEHLALRLADSYGQLIRWGLDMRGTVVPDVARDLIAALSRMVEDPLREFREWVGDVNAKLGQALEELQQDSSLTVRIESALVLTIDASIGAAVNRELAVVGKAIKKAK